MHPHAHVACASADSGSDAEEDGAQEDAQPASLQAFKDAMARQDLMLQRFTATLHEVQEQLAAQPAPVLPTQSGAAAAAEAATNAEVGSEASSTALTEASCHQQVATEVADEQPDMAQASGDAGRAAVCHAQGLDGHAKLNEVAAVQQSIDGQQDQQGQQHPSIVVLDAAGLPAHKGLPEQQAAAAAAAAGTAAAAAAAAETAASHAGTEAVADETCSDGKIHQPCAARPALPTASAGTALPDGAAAAMPAVSKELSPEQQHQHEVAVDLAASSLALTSHQDEHAPNKAAQHPGRHEQTAPQATHVAAGHDVLEILQAEVEAARAAEAAAAAAVAAQMQADMAALRGRMAKQASARAVLAIGTTVALWVLSAFAAQSA